MDSRSDYNRPGEDGKPGKSKKLSARDPGYDMHLKQWGIYQDDSKKPSNWTEIFARLQSPPAALLAARFTDEAYRDFCKRDRESNNESEVTNYLVPIIGGDNPFRSNTLFGHLKDLTDGSITKAKPDLWDGFQPMKVDRDVQEELGTYFMPSTNTILPCLPNFFTELKGRRGDADVCQLQALHDGGLGARGIHKLRLYIGQDNPYDENSYTIVASFEGGSTKLTLYTMHSTAPKESDRERRECDFCMTQLHCWYLNQSPDDFRQGLIAFNNARDWA